MNCCCGGTSYNPETASELSLVNVVVPEGCKPGQTIKVLSPDGSGRATYAIIPPECDYEGSSFLIRFPKVTETINREQQPKDQKFLQQQQEEQDIPNATVVSQHEELKICVQVPFGARVGSTMYAPVPGDANRVLPIRIPSRKVKKFYIGYTMSQTILRSDIPGPPPGEDGKKQNWHDNKLAVMAPLFF